jgi:uncharacterized protein YlxW (UPF0749 family)
VTRPGGRHTFGGPSTLTVSLVAALAGLLIGINAALFRTEQLGADGLVGMVADQEREIARLEALGAEMAAQIEALAAADDPPATPARGAEAWSDMAAGRTAIEGPGVSVTLDDAPAPPDRDHDLPLDSYVVHQSDLEAVLNTLWAAGAEAVAVQGQRLTAVSGVRCVGNVLLLGGRTYSPPYVIDAIGDSERLAEALNTSPLTEPYRSFAASAGLAWSVKSHAAVRIGAYPGGSITLRYIVEPKGAS